MTKKERKPRGYWLIRRDQLEVDARTMTHAQMAEKYDTTVVTMATCLRSMGIRRGLLYPGIEEMAKTMTAPELAEHFGVAVKRVRAILDLRGIKCQRMAAASALAGHKDDLARLALTMTQKDLARHFGVHRNAIARSLQKMGIQPAAMAAKPVQPTKPPKPPKLTKPKPKPKPVKAAKVETLVQTKPAPKPAARRKVVIIMPADAKITIADFRPPPGARICNGSSTQTYNPRERAISVRSGY